MPFIVQPSPPASTTFIHSITNRRSRQLLHLPAERTNADFLGNAFHESGEGIDIGDVLNTSRSRRPSITVDRQISESSLESVSTWVDLMLKETERGPQAWVFYHFYKRIATDQLIEVVVSICYVNILLCLCLLMFVLFTRSNPPVFTSCYGRSYHGYANSIQRNSL